MKLLDSFLRWWNCTDHVNVFAREAGEWATRFHAAEREIKQQEERLRRLLAEIAVVRVAQAEPPRVGWEVMAYIPEETLCAVPTPEVVRCVVGALVNQAVRGIYNIQKNGKVNVLVFAPLDMNRAPAAAEWVQVLWDKDGKCKLSEKLPRMKTAEQRVRECSL